MLFMTVMKKFSLTLVLIALFAFSLLGQVIEGHSTYNEKRVSEFKLPAVKISEYIKTGHFISALSENMESEFLQMALFVVLTVNLYQIGSSESNKLPYQKTKDDLNTEADEERHSIEQKKKHPFLWPIYERSLTIALFLIFTGFFLVHAYGSLLLVNEEHLRLHKPLLTFWQIFGESEFWFESFQNWQSEFFSVAILCLLSIFLRQKGSAQSKKLHRSIFYTGAN